MPSQPKAEELQMAQEGFKYEENAYEALQKYKISIGGTAGASHDKPDLTVQSNKKRAGVELKLSPTAAGSLVMKYSDGEWGFGDFKGDSEKEFLHALAKKFNLLREMNKSGSHGNKWRGKVPSLQNDPKTGKKLIIGAKDKRAAYAADLKKFGASNEVHIPIPARSICDYYITKHCSYIGVGTHGFYTLNNHDDLGLNKQLHLKGNVKIPDFSDHASAKIRVRCQYKGSGDYQFVMTLQFQSVKVSPYNIAPLKKGTGAEIDVAALKADPLLLAFKP